MVARPKSSPRGSACSTPHTLHTPNASCAAGRRRRRRRQLRGSTRHRRRRLLLSKFHEACLKLLDTHGSEIPAPSWCSASSRLWADVDRLETDLIELLGVYGYSPNATRLSALLRKMPGLGVELKGAPEVDRSNSFMDAGNAVRQR